MNKEETFRLADHIRRAHEFEVEVTAFDYDPITDAYSIIATFGQGQGKREQKIDSYEGFR